MLEWTVNNKYYMGFHKVATQSNEGKQMLFGQHQIFRAEKYHIVQCLNFSLTSEFALILVRILSKIFPS